MTPKQYRTRIEALGCPSGAAWARFVGIDRGAHTRHLMGVEHRNGRKIPKTLIIVLGWLESGDLKNPWLENDDFS